VLNSAELVAVLMSSDPLQFARFPMCLYKPWDVSCFCIKFVLYRGLMSQSIYKQEHQSSTT
jgi:hypothetical protein